MMKAFSPKLFADRPFSLCERPTGEFLMHNDKPVWIVFYEEVSGHHAAFYQAYIAVEKVPRGRHPWTMNNRCIGNPEGFKTLIDAMEAAEAAI